METQRGADRCLQIAVVELAQVALLDLAVYVIDVGAVGGVKVLFNRDESG
jgi:hypothetical protein